MSSKTVITHQIVPHIRRKVLPKLAGQTGKRAVLSASVLLKAVEKAEVRGNVRVLDRIARRALENDHQAVALIAAFRQAAMIERGTIDCTLRHRFPRAVANRNQIGKLLASATTSGGNASQIFEKIARLTEPTTGIHHLAKNFAELAAISPNSGAWLVCAARDAKSFGGHRFEDLFVMSESDVALSTVNAIGNRCLDSLKSYAHWGVGGDIEQFGLAKNMAADLAKLTSLMANLHGLPPSAKAQLQKTGQQLQEAMTVRRSIWPELFGVAQREITALQNGIKMLDCGYSQVSVIPITSRSVNPRLPIADQKVALMDQMIALKVNANKWQAFLPEHWAQITRTTTATETAVGQATVSSKGFFRPTQTTHVQSTVNSFASDVVRASTPVELPIPGLRVAAPRLSAVQVSHHRGDVILASKGRVHLVNSADPASIFAVATQEARRAAH